MLITYHGNDEVLVTTTTREAKLLKEWFKDGDRDVNLYDRVEHRGESGVSVEANLIVG